MHQNVTEENQTSKNSKNVEHRSKVMANERGSKVGSEYFATYYSENYIQEWKDHCMNLGQNTQDLRKEQKVGENQKYKIHYIAEREREFGTTDVVSCHPL